MAVKPAFSSALIAAEIDMPEVLGTVVGTPLTAVLDGATKSSFGKLPWIACIAAAHIGPAKPEPDTDEMYEPPMVWPASGIGRCPSLLAPAIIAAVASLVV